MTIVMRCPKNTLLVGDDVGWGNAPPKPPTVADSATQASKDAQAHWRRTHWTLDARDGSTQGPRMHDVSCPPRDHSLFRLFTFLLDKNGQLNYNIDITEPKAWII